MTRPTSGVVLAGGTSRRMGRDKRVVPVGEEPLLARAVTAVAAVTAEVLVVASPQAPLAAAHGARVVVDERDDAGPLAGLEAGLTAAAHPEVLVLAGDHPAAAAEVLAALRERLWADHALDAVFLGTERGPQPLVAACRRRARATVSRLLDAGERRATALCEALPAATLPVEEWRRLDPTGSTAVDLDTPADLRRWRAGTADETGGSDPVSRERS